MSRRVRRALVAVMVTLVSCIGVAAAGMSPASALCAESPIAGDWHNIDAGTRAMTRVVVETCQPIVTCDGEVCTIQHDAGTFISAFGKCHPTDCSWGRVLSTSEFDGWQKAVYNFGFKTSSVWVKTYEYWGLTYLRVWVYNDFTPADGRPDYTTDEWFLK